MLRKLLAMAICLVSFAAWAPLNLAAAEDRVAVFGLDGTLTCETYPFCFGYMAFAAATPRHSPSGTK